MAYLANSMTASVGTIILIVIIVIVIITVWNRQNNENGNREGRHRQQRFRVKANVTDDQERFEVQRSHRRRRRSSSLNSPSSDDIITVGLGGICSGLQTQCASGLSCEDQRCVCPRPGTPVVQVAEVGINSITADWLSVPRADYYNVVLYKLTATGAANPVEVVNGLTATTINFNNLTAGTYRVEVTAGNRACGVLPNADAGVALIIVGCQSNSSCPNATPICDQGTCVQCGLDSDCPSGFHCQSGSCVLTTGQGVHQACDTSINCSLGLDCVNHLCEITNCPRPSQTTFVALTQTLTVPGTLSVSWTPVTGADLYRVTVYKIETDHLLSILGEEIIVAGQPTMVNFLNIQPGTYVASVLAGSNVCGFPLSTVEVFSNNVTFPCLTPLQPPANVNVETTPAGPGQTTVTVTWFPVVGADRYLVTITRLVGTVESEEVFQGIVTGNQLTTIVPNLLAGESYRVDVSSDSDACGLSSTATSSTFVTCVFAQPVTNLTETQITAQNGDILSNLMWTVSQTATSYDIQIYDTSTTPPSLVSEADGQFANNISFFLDFGTYRADVYAVNSCGRSLASSVFFNVV
jgi:Cys-rich repeat protein